jgi:hypothetical protein
MRRPVHEVDELVDVAHVSLSPPKSDPDSQLFSVRMILGSGKFTFILLYSNIYAGNQRWSWGRHRTRGDRIAQVAPSPSHGVDRCPKCYRVFMLRREDGCAMARRGRGPHLLLWWGYGAMPADPVSHCCTNREDWRQRTERAVNEIRAMSQHAYPTR